MRERPSSAAGPRYCPSCKMPDHGSIPCGLVRQGPNNAAIVTPAAPGQAAVDEALAYAEFAVGEYGITGRSFKALAAEVRRLRALLAEAQEGLGEILKGYGEFDRDPLKHASNTIDSMKAVARRAQSKLAAELQPPAAAAGGAT